MLSDKFFCGGEKLVLQNSYNRWAKVHILSDSNSFNLLKEFRIDAGYFAADSGVWLFEDFLGAEEIGYAVEPCVAAGAGRGLVLDAVVAQAECVQLALNAHAAHLFPNLRYSLIRFAGVGLTKF